MYKFFKRVYYWSKVLFYTSIVIVVVLFSTCSNSQELKPCIMAAKIEQVKNDRSYISASIRCDKPYKIYVNNPFNNMPAKSVLNSDHATQAYTYHFWINSDEYGRLVLTYENHRGH